jgi:hypothetical protein
MPQQGHGRARLARQWQAPHSFDADEILVDLVDEG